jgi:hypothetical protein
VDVVGRHLGCQDIWLFLSHIHRVPPTRCLQPQRADLRWYSLPAETRRVPARRHGDPTWLPSNNKECKRTRPLTLVCCAAFYGQCAAGWAAGTDHCSQNAARHVKEELNGVGMSCLCIDSPKHPHPEFGWDQHASFLHLCSRHVSFFMGIGTSLRIPTTLYAVLMFSPALAPIIFHPRSTRKLLSLARPSPHGSTMLGVTTIATGSRQLFKYQRRIMHAAATP